MPKHPPAWMRRLYMAVQLSPARGSSDRQEEEESPCAQARCGFGIFRGRTSLISSKMEDWFFYRVGCYSSTARCVSLPIGTTTAQPTAPRIKQVDRRDNEDGVLCKYMLPLTRAGLRCRESSTLISQPANFLPLGWEVHSVAAPNILIVQDRPFVTH